MELENSTNAGQQFTLILRRLQEPFPSWVVLVPIGAVALLYMVIMFQRYRPAGGPLWSRLVNRLVGPPWAALLVALACGAYAFLGLRLRPAFGWWVVLVPVLTIAFVYVGFMYYRDARSVGVVWASFLGLLRSAVYLLLAAVFLLPAWQESSTSETTSKVLLVFDVSASHSEKDDVPEPGQDLKKLLSRQDKVIKFLTDDQVAFLRRLHRTNPVTCYRFGLGVDDTPKEYPKGKMWTEKELAAWLKIDPDRKGLDQKQEELERRLYGGTNIGDSLLQVFNKEGGNMLQAIVIVSDGQSNEGKEQAYEELKELASKAKPPVPIMCIGVGKSKPEVSIKVNDLEVPTTARPDEPFPVLVPVASKGLKDYPYEVQLEVARVEDNKGKPVKGERYPFLKKTSTHKSDEPDRVEFEIDVAALKKITAKDDKDGELEGTWEFRARVARDRREAFDKPYHQSARPARVKVLKKKMRVLLFAGGPSKEYQFVRTLFYREVKEERMQLGIYLQTGKEEEIDQDVDKDWLLDQFPYLRVSEKPEDQPYTLFDYDLVIAFDPDWSMVATPALQLLEEWVKDSGGGLVLLGGPVNTYQLARPPKDLTPILNLYPVVLDDSRLQGLGQGFNPTVKHALKFPGANRGFEFLKLDEEGEGATAGWNEFFYDDANPPRDAELVRGFYSYYPVKEAKSVATVIATFPAEQNAAGLPDQPWLVTMTPGTGKTVFIGSHELWRLRTKKEQYHERFWIKLARYAGAGNLGRLQAYGDANIPERMVIDGNKKQISYRLRGRDRKLLKKEMAAQLQVFMARFAKPDDARPDPTTRVKIDLAAKPSSRNEETGWFMADVPMTTPGKYEFELKIPGTSEILRNTTIATRPNPELDNVKPNLLRLYNLASDNQLVLGRVNSDEVKKKIRELKGPEEDGAKSISRDGKKLYFSLDSAALIPDCMITDRDKKTTIGDVQDIWDKGYDTDYEILGWKVEFSWVMLIIVTLLSVEWLTRKLLKLA